MSPPARGGFFRAGPTCAITRIGTVRITSLADIHDTRAVWRIHVHVNDGSLVRRRHLSAMEPFIDTAGQSDHPVKRGGHWMDPIRMLILLNICVMVKGLAEHLF